MSHQREFDGNGKNLPQVYANSRDNHEERVDVTQDESATESEQEASTLSQIEKKSEEISSTLSHLEEAVSALSQKIDTRLKYDQTKEKAFDYLYAELEELKQNSALDNLKPLYLDLILLFDRIESIRCDLSQQSSETNSKASEGDELTQPSSTTACHTSNLLQTLSDELLDILERRGGIEIIETEDSAPFNREVQRAIKTQTTTVEAENNQVAEVVRRGFKSQNRLLRAEEVIVKKYQENSTK